MFCVLLLVTSAAGRGAEPNESQSDDQLVIESSRLKLVLRDDLRGFAHLIDKRSGRDYAADTRRAFGLYTLHFGKSMERSTRSTLSMVAAKEVSRTEQGVRVRFEQKGTHPALVDCLLSASAERPEIRLSIDITNRSNQPIITVDFPQLTCVEQLDSESADDGILYPQHEGIVLCGPAEHFPEGSLVAKAYPGHLSAQFSYYFDAAGGLYLGAHDTQGYPKQLRLDRTRDGLNFTWRHQQPSVQLARYQLKYELVLMVGGPTWQHGADIYRQWAERKAPWCRQTIVAGAAPDWLQAGCVFLNYKIDPDDEQFGVEQHDALLGQYREFLGLPIVACAFGWEKHGSWIGPDYFPPRGGEQYYRDLAARLQQRGDHLHVFTSGFRWGVRKRVEQQDAKPEGGVSEQRSQGYDRSAPARPPSPYTEYYGERDYRNAGGWHMAVLNDRGYEVREMPAWADNYLLCPGCAATRQLLGKCFDQIYELGIAGVDLDQNLGGGIPPCYSGRHDHESGAGTWQYRAVYEFLDQVRRRARTQNVDSFVGLEEPCELFIPVVDIVHGRAFTDTVWPANGPGAMSVPLYAYLYHPYQLQYAGWIDGRFSPRGDVRLGLVRAALLGMQPGVRIHSGPFQLADGQPSDELIMLRNVAQLTVRCREYLLLGACCTMPSSPVHRTWIQSHAQPSARRCRSPGRPCTALPGKRLPATSATCLPTSPTRRGPSNCWSSDMTWLPLECV